MFRAVEKLRGGALFHDLARPQHDDVVGEGADDPQVVADKHIGKIVLCLDTAQEVDDLRLFFENDVRFLRQFN